MFTHEDLHQIKERGSVPEIIENQVNQFAKGFPYADIVAAATAGNGILVYSEKEKEELASYFDTHKSALDIARFVPASGAATRMFKSLFSIRDELKKLHDSEVDAYINANKEAASFFHALHTYPFFNDLPEEIKKSPVKVMDYLLEPDGLNYGNLPKGLLKFHSYGKESRTAFEEHLHEAVRIIAPGKEIKLHFTVSEEHMPGFRKEEDRVVPLLEKQYGVKFTIGYSFQKKETDTIAVDMANKPFRDEGGRLVFRPGGHGALIENLNDLDHDLIYINNIDNVSPENNSEKRVLSKKMLAGLLLKTRNRAFELVNKLKYNKPGATDEAMEWLKELNGAVIPENQGREELKQWLLDKIDRPIRVCGMVINEGEPGGGPFHVRNSNGVVSLQIVEASQIDQSHPGQMELLKKASHFNPVDLVCSVRKPDGGKYHLPEYIDPETGFISEKSVKGRDLKALELPGLWNGSMAGWLTLFVEIPAATFTPVKTVFDLVRPAHLS